MEAVEKEGRGGSGEGHNRASGLGREGVALASWCLRPWGCDPLNHNELSLWGLCVECSQDSVRIDGFLVARLLS